MMDTDSIDRVPIWILSIVRCTTIGRPCGCIPEFLKYVYALFANLSHRIDEDMNGGLDEVFERCFGFTDLCALFGCIDGVQFFMVYGM